MPRPPGRPAPIPEQGRLVAGVAELHEVAHRQQAALAEQGRKLVDRGDERDEVNGGDSALEHLASEPVVASIEPVHVSTLGCLRHSGQWVDAGAGCASMG